MRRKDPKVLSALDAISAMGARGCSRLAGDHESEFGWMRTRIGHLAECFLKALVVSWEGSPSGRGFSQISRVRRVPKLPGPRRNTTSLPSHESEGISAESLKSVSCSQRR